MKGPVTTRAAQLALCIAFALASHSTLAGTVSDCSAGGSTSATGNQAVACGYHDVASGAGSDAFGKYNQASGLRATAVGFNNYAYATGSVALGSLNHAG